MTTAIEYIVEYDNESDGEFVVLSKEDIPLFGVKPSKIINGNLAHYKFKFVPTKDELMEEHEQSNWSYKQFY